MDSRPSSGSLEWRRYAAVLAAGLIPAAGILFKVSGFNGPKYWRWHYSHDAVVPYLLVTVPAGALLLWARQRWRRAKRASAISLLLAAQFFLMFAYIGLTRDGIQTIAARIHDPTISSYYAAALGIFDLHYWISHYDQLLPGFPQHAQVHPPGPILYFFVLQRILGPPAAMLWGGIAIGVAATFTIPAIYAFTRWVTADAEGGFAAATLWTVLPGAIVMLPEVDQVYPLFTILLVYLWTRALMEDRLLYPIAFAAALFVSLLFHHAFLVLGAYLVLSAVCAVSFSKDRSAAARRVLRTGSVSLILLLALFASLYVTTRYNHLAALRQSVTLQDRFLHQVRRPYPSNVPWDTYDFFLGSGWIPAALLVLAAARWRSQRNSLPEAVRIFVPAAWGCLLIVNLSGLMPGEAARLWLFLQPLVIPVAGAELARWPRRWRLAACGVALFVLAVIRARLVFFWS